MSHSWISHAAAENADGNGDVGPRARCNEKEGPKNLLAEQLGIGWRTVAVRAECRTSGHRHSTTCTKGFSDGQDVLVLVDTAAIFVVGDDLNHEVGDRN